MTCQKVLNRPIESETQINHLCVMKGNKPMDMLSVVDASVKSPNLDSNLYRVYVQALQLSLKQF